MLDLEARIDRWLNRAKAPSLPYRGSKTVKKHLIRPAVDEPDSGAVEYDPEKHGPSQFALKCGARARLVRGMKPGSPVGPCRTVATW